MHIALVFEHANPLTDPDGAGAHEHDVFIAEHAAALARAGHRVDVYTRRSDTEYEDEVVTADGYRVLQIAAGPPVGLSEADRLQCMSAFGSALRDRWVMEKPDLVHSHHWLSALAAGLAAREVGVPTVVTFHSLGSVEHRFTYSSGARPTRRMIFERQIAKCADAIIATDTNQVDELNRMGVARSKVSVIPYGVNLDIFNPDGRAATKGHAGRRIVCAGELAPTDGFEVVLALVAATRNTDLIIVGGPERAALDEHPEAGRLRAHADNLGVAQRLTLTGKLARSETAAVMRSADLVMCTPSVESFGLSALHAMACGVPVVASAAGGLPDTIVDGITGEFVDTRNIRKLAHTVERLLADSPRRFALGVAGVDRVQSRYSWPRIAEDTARQYARVVPHEQLSAAASIAEPAEAHAS